jgi:segregation and condensation protein A
MRDLDFDLASEFLVMASTLLQWKSKSLLPQDENAAALTAEDEPELTQEELVRQLMEHRKFRAAGASLSEFPWLGDDVFARPNPRAAIERTWKHMEVTDLVTSYQDFLTRARKRTKVLRKETVSLSEKILQFRDRLSLGEMKELRALIEAGGERPEIVVTFLAALELSRMKKLRVHQEITYGPILLELIESLGDIDVAAAIGFEAIRAVENPIPVPQPEAASVEMR